MSNKVKDIDIKNSTYYFFNDIINLKIFDANNIKIDETSYKNILFLFEIRKILQCKSFIPYFQQNE